jgi:hypothetical protein
MVKEVVNGEGTSIESFTDKKDAEVYKFALERQNPDRKYYLDYRKPENN